jgi:hypothetical protein
VRGILLAASFVILCLAGCGDGSGTLGNGGSGTGGGGTTPTGSNVQAITIDSGPAGLLNAGFSAINTAYTTVTICAPGSTTNCQTIDHIQVDTGSSGLRILASQLTISLPLQTDGSGNVIAECTPFADGVSWGPIGQADVKVGGETALAQEVQIIGDGTYTNIPQACSDKNPNAENTVAMFGANGLLGVGPFIQDCGSSCTVQGGAAYFTCPSATATCTDSGIPLTLQVANPVASFTTDNNGVIIQLPSVGATGAAALSGYLIFGIDTKSNNALGTSTVLELGPAGEITTQYKQGSLSMSFIDSGSNAFYFPDSTIKTCDVNTAGQGFLCPPSTQNLSGTMVSQVSGTSVTVNFSIANASTLFTGTTAITAASNLGVDSNTLVDPNNLNAGLGTNAFDWGLPFFYGHSVYTAIENRNTSGGAGPYFAF